MAGKRKPLSPAQQIALNEVADARRAYRNGREETEARIRAEVQRENAALEMAYALKIRRAKELEIPQRTIGSIGMGTSDPHTVTRWLAKTQRMVAHLNSTGSPAGVFAWENKAEGLVRVKFDGFPTTIVAEDYPLTLEGIAKLDPEGRAGWSVHSDPGSKETELGPLPGWFTVEITEIGGTVEDSLTTMLDQWVEANR